MEITSSASAVPALLAASGLSPVLEEVTAMADAYTEFRESVDALYRVPEARYTDPALRFRAADTTRADWASAE